MKNRVVLGLIVVLAFVVSVNAYGLKVDLNGNWVLDGSKSEGLPEGMQQTMTVVQNGDAITIETTFATDEGNQTIKDSYTLSGKEEPFTAYWGQGAKGKRIAKWNADGNGFEVNEEATFEAMEKQVTGKMNRKWAMAADGKSLTIVLTFNGPNGEVVTKRVFTKKS
jgi:hypothetical protein